MSQPWPQSVAEWNARGAEYLPGTIGMEILSVEPDAVRARMPVSRRLCAWNGFLHAGAVVSFADSGKTIARFRCTQMILSKQGN